MKSLADILKNISLYVFAYWMSNAFCFIAEQIDIDMFWLTVSFFCELHAAELNKGKR